MKLARLATLASLLGMGALSACHSYHVEASVENRTGGDIELLEVDYPSASFGTGHLGAGATFPYSFQVRGAGPVKVQYTESASRIQHQISGPDLHERQEGTLQVVLLPGGKAEFHPSLSPAP